MSASNSSIPLESVISKVADTIRCEDIAKSTPEALANKLLNASISELSPPGTSEARKEEVRSSLFGTIVGITSTLVGSAQSLGRGAMNAASTSACAVRNASLGAASSAVGAVTYVASSTASSVASAAGAVIGAAAHAGHTVATAVSNVLPEGTTRVVRGVGIGAGAIATGTMVAMSKNATTTWACTAAGGAIAGPPGLAAGATVGTVLNVLSIPSHIKVALDIGFMANRALPGPSVLTDAIHNPVSPAFIEHPIDSLVYKPEELAAGKIAHAGYAALAHIFGPAKKGGARSRRNRKQSRRQRRQSRRQRK